MTSNLIGSKEVDIGFDKDKQSINVAYRINPLVVVFCRVSFAKLVFQGKFGGKAAHYFVNCILNISINAINNHSILFGFETTFPNMPGKAKYPVAKYNSVKYIANILLEFLERCCTIGL